MKIIKLTAFAIFIASITAMLVRERIKDKATTVVAGAAIASPAWLPKLQDVSDLSALLMPIAGLIWLIVQIYTKITRAEGKKGK